jgi:predicted pyridoxine 5'-phosphate oxidase superfamily flavin-nucleotide-binding protein
MNAPLSLQAGDASPFHEGEQRLQTLTGRRDKMEALGRSFIRDHMPDQHRAFFAQLPFIVVGGMDERHQPWATLWAGPPGFMHSPEPTVLRIDRPCQCEGDPLAGHWAGHWASPSADGAPIGLLGIEPHTRRRNRLNGTLHRGDGDESWHVRVRQSFGNCPKYIRTRLLSWRGLADLPQSPVSTAPQVQHHTGPLSDQARALIAQADTFFLASSSPHAGQAGQQRADGVDVSHRGGEPGFVRIEERKEEPQEGEKIGHTLLVPDYTGNFMFNTLGNILLQPRIGLLFIDFDRGDMLWLAAHGEVDLDSPRIAEFPGALRLLRVQVDEWIFSAAALPLHVEATVD